MFVILDHYLDPCDRINCNGTNAVCQIVFETGKPFCACERGFTGDPNVNCGKYATLAMNYVLVLTF